MSVSVSTLCSYNFFNLQILGLFGENVAIAVRNQVWDFHNILKESKQGFVCSTCVVLYLLFCLLCCRIEDIEFFLWVESKKLFDCNVVVRSISSLAFLEKNCSAHDMYLTLFRPVKCLYYHSTKILAIQVAFFDQNCCLAGFCVFMAGYLQTVIQLAIFGGWKYNFDHRHSDASMLDCNNELQCYMEVIWKFTVLHLDE